MSEPKKILVVLSGASGSGKTTLCRHVERNLGFFYAVSYTTRTKRPHETEDSDYHFVTLQKFQKLIDDDGFLEWAQVHDNYYGTPREEVESKLAAGVSVIVDVDTQGAFSIQKKFPEALLIFISAPSSDELKKRLVNRGGDADEAIAKRLQAAQLEESLKSSYHHVIINDDIDQAYTELVDHIQKYQSGNTFAKS